jgi:hypothetical protein
MKRVLVLAAVLASSAGLGAQQVVTFSTPGGEITTNYITLESKTLTGAPYAAETVNESTQTLADGNRIVQHTTGRVYRDSEGRVRREEDGRGEGVSADHPVVVGGPSVSIVDPVAGVSYTLDPVRHLAWKTSTGASVKILQDALQFKVRSDEQKVETGAGFKVDTVVSGGAGGRFELRRDGNSNEQHSEETLGPQLIEGVIADGHRNTTTIAAGSIGNEKPITIVSEEWRSPDLGVLVMTSHKDPRNGDSSYRLVNIVRGEPDPSLFQVPADYTIRETGVRRLEQRQEER